MAAPPTAFDKLLAAKGEAAAVHLATSRISADALDALELDAAVVALTNTIFDLAP